MKELWLVTMLHNQWLQKILAGLFLAVTAYAETNSIQLSPQDISKITEQQAIVDEIPREDELDPYFLAQYFSQKYDVNLNLVFSIIDCESGWDRFAANKTSSAKSYFQILKGTWAETMIRMGLPTTTDVYNPYYHINAGVWLISQGELERWSESSRCWNGGVALK